MCRPDWTVTRQSGRMTPMSVTTARHPAVPHGSLADRTRRNIERRIGALGLSQRRGAARLGLSQQALSRRTSEGRMGGLRLRQRLAAARLRSSHQSLSDRTSGHTPGRLNEVEGAGVTLEMDLTRILGPVDDDLELTLIEPLEDARVQQQL